MTDTVLGRLEVELASDTTGSGTGGQVRWTYSVDSTALHFLAADESRTESFDLTLDDTHGGVVSRRIDIVIKGSNDAVVISSGRFDGAVVEMATPAGLLSSDGSITFSDADLSDRHRVTADGIALGDTLGRLSLVLAADTDNAAHSGRIDWIYQVDAAAVEFLSAGQTIVDQFSFIVDDGRGGSVTRSIAITITGTDDAAVFESGQVVGQVVDRASPAAVLSSSGSIVFSDVDRDDVHSVVPTARAIGAVLGSVELDRLRDSSGAGQSGELRWTYRVDSSAVAWLAQGDSKVEQFMLELVDQNGRRFEQPIEVTILGSNDAPVIVAAAPGGAVTESSNLGTPLTDSGLIVYRDADLRDAPRLSFSVKPADQVLGSLSVVRDPVVPAAADEGRLAWIYQVDPAAVVYLGAGQTRVDRFDIIIVDEHGASVTHRIDVTITGTNNAPTVTAAAIDQEVTMGDSFSFVVPTPTFADADVNDRLRFTAMLADGSPLPAWLKFDAERLIFSGTAPGGTARILSVSVIAADSNGAAAVASFELHLQVRPTIAPDVLPVAETPRQAPAEVATVRQTIAVAETRIVVLTPQAVAEAPVDAAAEPAPSLRDSQQQTAQPMRRNSIGSIADQVLAQALTAEFGALQMSALVDSLNGGELLRRLEELQRQIEGQASSHQTAIASSIAVTTGLSVGYVVWLVRGGLLLSSLLSTMPAWQMIDPLPVLSSGRGGAARGDDEQEEDDEEVERMFSDRRRPPAALDPIAPQSAALMPITSMTSPAAGQAAHP